MDFPTGFPESALRSTAHILDSDHFPDRWAPPISLPQDQHNQRSHQPWAHSITAMGHLSGDQRVAIITIVEWLHRFQRTYERKDKGWVVVEKCLRAMGRVLTRCEARAREGTAIRRVNLEDEGGGEGERRRTRRRTVDWEREPLWVQREFRHLCR